MNGVVEHAPTPKTLLLVGVPGRVHVGGHLERAAKNLGVPTVFCNVEDAFSGRIWLDRINWRLRGHRPSKLREFGRHVVQTCARVRPSWLLATGIAPLDADALGAIGRLGIERMNYLTDDPWNRAHRSPWFMQALPAYDRVFSPRHANLDDLRHHGCGEVSYLPFAYAPDVHYPPTPGTPGDGAESPPDVVFAGGADSDRVPFLAAVAEAGFSLSIYGGYWHRQRALHRFARGIADPDALRQATSAARIAVCLVRRANRDGHVMRSFEIPAVGGCMLAEDTHEHRDIFGQEGDAVLYFSAQQDMLEKIRWLLAQPSERSRLAMAAHRLIVNGRHTYSDRLTTMLQLSDTASTGSGEACRT